MDVEGCLKKDLEVYQSSKGHFYEFCWRASFYDFMIFQEKCRKHLSQAFFSWIWVYTGKMGNI
jgi:hypothetical protein